MTHNAVTFTLNGYTGKIQCPHCGHENTGWLFDPREVALNVTSVSQIFLSL